jgi:hypothetical protein
MALLKLLDPVRRLLAPAEPVAIRARRLADAGRYRDAIDLLAPVPAEAIDLETLRDLVRWRNAAFAPEAGRPDWPPQVPDPFPGIQRPPEIEAKALTAAILAGAIQHHGCLLVRGLIDAAQTERLAAVVTQALEAGTGGADQPVSPWFAPYPLQPGDGMTNGAREFGLTSGAVWTADSPHALAIFLDFLKSHGVVRVIEEYLGERAFLSIGKSTLRRVPPDAHTGWHQDGRFLGADIRTVNCWLALSDCGDDAPGLDLFPKRQAGLVESGTKGAFDWWVVGDGVAAEMARTTPIVSPLFKSGDAMLFDQLLLHRTGVRPGLTRARLAIESWFFAGSTFPMKQMPLAL